MQHDKLANKVVSKTLNYPSAVYNAIKLSQTKKNITIKNLQNISYLSCS